MRRMLQQAEAVLGYDILHLCLNGPKEKLDDTAYSQPALYIANLAAVEMLRHTEPDAVSSCSATAGVLSATPLHDCAVVADMLHTTTHNDWNECMWSACFSRSYTNACLPAAMAQHISISLLAASLLEPSHDDFTY